jgi:hypothetical protein
MTVRICPLENLKRTFSDSIIISNPQMMTTIEVVPKTAANFRAIAEGSTSDVKQTYKNSIFHRIIPGVRGLPSVIPIWRLTLIYDAKMSLQIGEYDSSCSREVILNGETGPEDIRSTDGTSMVGRRNLTGQK